MSNNTSLAFGAGVLIGTPAGGSPLQFGTLQDVSVDFSFSVKQLMGQFQFPVAVARGAGKISGKAKFANIDGPTLNQIFFGNALATGQKLWSYNEGATVPAASPYTATVANAGSFDENLGVAYASSGLQLTQVATSPAQGQYSVAAGVYTFNSADSGKALQPRGPSPPLWSPSMNRAGASERRSMAPSMNLRSVSTASLLTGRKIPGSQRSRFRRFWVFICNAAAPSGLFFTPTPTTTWRPISRSPLATARRRPLSSYAVSAQQPTPYPM